MENLLQQLQKKKSWKSFLKTQCRRNSVSPSVACTFTVLKFRKFFDEKPKHIEITDKLRKKSLVWLQNELKAYQWYLIVMSGCSETLIQNFTMIQWDELSKIFEKEPSILQYEAIKLISQRRPTKRKWGDEESNLLEGIVNQNDANNKWNETARKLFQLSKGKYFRSGKQCREQWLNHLDPKKKHGQWLASEDLAIVQFILHKGKKWAQIVKTLKNARTEHMIKNRFKTMLIRLRKKYENVTSQSQLLQLRLREIKENIQEESSIQRGVQLVQKKREKERPDFSDLPVMGGEQDQEHFDGEYQGHERISTGGFRELDIQQVVTPCPNIYQIFTPNFLNTPHAMTSFLSSNFGFPKNDNLFLKNN